MMAERGLSLAHTTILRWVRSYTSEFVKRWNRFRKSCGRSWRVDETYIKVRGKWVYLYRAVDKSGQAIDFRLSRTRSIAAAKAFFKKAVRQQGQSPQTITLDGYAASHRLFGIWKTRDPAEADQGAVLQVSEQSDRAGSSWHQVQNPSYARLQKLCLRRHRDRRLRTSSPHPQAPVRAEAAKAQRPSCASNLECRTCRISAIHLP